MADKAQPSPGRDTAHCIAAFLPPCPQLLTFYLYNLTLLRRGPSILGKQEIDFCKGSPETEHRRDVQLWTRVAMNEAQHKIVNLLKTFFVLLSVFISVCIFNVWPKTTLLPVWHRDTKRLDTPGKDSNMTRQCPKGFCGLKAGGRALSLWWSQLQLLCFAEVTKKERELEESQSSPFQHTTVTCGELRWPQVLWQASHWRKILCPFTWTWAGSVMAWVIEYGGMLLCQFLGPDLKRCAACPSSLWEHTVLGMQPSCCEEA